VKQPGAGKPPDGCREPKAEVEPNLMMEAPIKIGTSGWSYPGGRGTWNGVFYPPARRGSKIDELAYYAERFDTVEVNSTFYRVPAPNVTASWVRRTPPGFEFAVKLFQKFTHPSMFAKSSGATDLSVGRDDVDAFRTALDPLASAGRLGPLLVQFPPSFKQEPASTEYLRWLLSAFRDYSVAVELRHSTWSDARDETHDLLEKFGAAWVQIDEPKFRFSIAQDLRPNTSSFFYLRLHGRNAREWWSHDASEDRYNYLYSSEELEPFAEAASAARRLVKKLYLYTNNHFEAKSAANALMLKQKLGLPLQGTYEESFLSRYPQLAGALQPSPAEPPGPPAKRPATSPRKLL
jgi:uncharacterized protein YecE (DUF72 family)